MLGRAEDLTGRVFGRWTVSRFGSKSKNGTVKWVCKCECGAESEVFSHVLRNGRSVSCGCYAREVASKSRTKHGLHDTRAYHSWRSMKSRCYNTNDPDYKSYGGRGITVCPEWENDFGRFFKDMGERPEMTSLDRVDVNGHYEKDNCRWSTPKVQANNRRNSKRSTVAGALC